MKPIAIPVRFGIATSGCLIAYFLILSLFNLHTKIFYSNFNSVITAFGIYEAINSFRMKKGNNVNYGKGFTAGIVTGWIATQIFTIFFTVYATELNTGFLGELSKAWFNEYNYFEAIIFFTVAIMGFATTLVLTLSFMQLFESSNDIKKKSP